MTSSLSSSLPPSATIVSNPLSLSSPSSYHRQADNLLERLILRMIGTDSMTQKRNLSYCISRLPITDKGVKKMMELLRYWLLPPPLPPPLLLYGVINHILDKQKIVYLILRSWNY